MEPGLVNPVVDELRHVAKLNRPSEDVPNRIVFVMLSNLKAQTTQEVTSAMEAWCYLFNNELLRTEVKMVQETVEISDPEYLVNFDPAIKEFLDRLEYSNLPWFVLEQYRNSLHRCKRNYDSLMDIVNKAKVHGKAQELAQWKAEGKAEIIKTMLQNGTGIAVMARITGMSIEEIEAISTMK